jgi:hypothetical protein
MRVIGTKEFALGNSNQREIKRVPLRQIERLRFTAERDGNMFHESPKLSLRGFSLLLRNIFYIYFAHMKRL